MSATASSSVDVAIIGGAAGGALVVFLLVCILLCVCVALALKRRRKRFRVTEPGKANVISKGAPSTSAIASADYQIAEVVTPTPHEYEEITLQPMDKSQPTYCYSDPGYY